jgi:sugar-specific transcriptional regulator TrmB
MSISDRAKRILRELGLTEYETRAYLSLLEKGATTASKVSEHANVPYSKNYDTLIIIVKLTISRKKSWDIAINT